LLSAGFDQLGQVFALLVGEGWCVVEEGFEDGEVMVVAEEIGKSPSLVGGRSQERLPAVADEAQVVPVVLGALTPLVQ
jgi:hypothetical protein